MQIISKLTKYAYLPTLNQEEKAIVEKLQLKGDLPRRHYIQNIHIEEKEGLIYF